MPPPSLRPSCHRMMLLLSPLENYSCKVSPRKNGKRLPTKISQILTPRKKSKNFRAKCLPMKTKIIPAKITKEKVSTCENILASCLNATKSPSILIYASSKKALPSIRCRRQKLSFTPIDASFTKAPFTLFDVSSTRAPLSFRFFHST